MTSVARIESTWRGTGRLRRLTVVIRYENVLRLLEFLGYPQAEELRNPEDGLSRERCDPRDDQPPLDTNSPFTEVSRRGAFSELTLRTL